MTVSYGSVIATVKYGSFFRLLFRWRGSLYKLVWPGLLVYCLCYALVAIAYNAIPDRPEYYNAKLMFVRICYYAGRVANAVPLSFVLAFYVNLVVDRWWQQFLALPTPDAVCLLVSAYIGESSDSREQKFSATDIEKPLVYRRTITRYINLASALCFRSISVGMKQRFPTLDSMVAGGLMTEQEMEIYSKLDDSTNCFFVPLVWAISLISKAREERMIIDDRHVDAMVTQVVNFWEKLYTLCMYDWVNVPLVYNQVVALAVYIYFGVTIFAHQFIDVSVIIKAANLKINTSSITTPNSSIVGNPINVFSNLSALLPPSSDNSTNSMPFLQVYPNFPLFTILSFIFYNGWLKVAESLVSPFGDDDDDFEAVPLLERNLNASLYFVDASISNPDLIPHLVKTVCRIDVDDYDNDGYSSTGNDGDGYSRSTTPAGRRTMQSFRSRADSQRSSVMSPGYPDPRYFPPSPATLRSIMDNDIPYLPPSRQRKQSHTAFKGSLAVLANPKESDSMNLQINSPYLDTDQGGEHLSPDTLIASMESSIHRLGSRLKKFSHVLPGPSSVHGVVRRTPRSANLPRTESFASFQSDTIPE
ncbi:unnamed protein product [Trichobilharzia szidati]|nr:unnamed protein product [Trichobilharzia szidati]